MFNLARITCIGLCLVSAASCGGDGGGVPATTPLANKVARFAYVANFGSNNVSVYTINASTGALRPGTAVAAGSQPFSVTTTGTIQ